MFGATVKVDMVTTRKSNFGRFKVAVLNPTLVPNKMDCIIGTRFFELCFAIEPFGTENVPTEGKKKDGEDGDDNPNRDADTEMEEANKKPRKDSSSSKSLDKQNDPTGEQQRDGTLEGFDEDGLLDDVGDGSIPMMTSETVIGEDHATSLGLDDGVPLQPNITVDLVLDTTGTNSVPEEIVTGDNTEPIHPSPALGPFLERALARLKEKQIGDQGLVDDKAILAEEGFVTPRSSLASGNIGTPLRRSKRHEASVDEDSIERAARLVAKKNMEVDEGKPYNNSILSLSQKM
ncbi:unnamed protein product [Urochloa decumbens]|uniref:Uncharacterized protein n=1 Tax=Urochloa decumbens TaxID=240449 RepID=A0ABC9BS42_9POAL